MLTPPAPLIPMSTREDITRVIELQHQPVDSWTYGGLYLVELVDGTFLLRHGVDIADQLAKLEAVA